MDNYNRMDPNTKLSKLGIDSLMLTEIQQILENDFDIMLSTYDYQTFDPI